MYQKIIRFNSIQELQDSIDKQAKELNDKIGQKDQKIKEMDQKIKEHIEKESESCDFCIKLERGDKLMIKFDAIVNTYDTADYKSDEIAPFQYHSIYEYDIENIVK